MKRILVLVEHRDDELEQVSFELLGEATRLAAAENGEVLALVLGSGVHQFAPGLARHGAQKTLLADDPSLTHYDPNIWLATIAQLCEQQAPDLLLLPATSSGNDLAARLAVAKNWPLALRCSRVRTTEYGTIETARPLYDGKLQEWTKGVCPGPYLVTVAPGVLGVRPSITEVPVVTAPVEVILPEDPRVRVTGFIPADPDHLDLTEADVIIAAGRGLGGEENVRMVKEVAVLLGGAVASTRVVVDLGWLGRETQVGQTGSRVRPRLYVACGISGATQHTVGMKESAAVIAINTDPAAPIFKIADLALNGDVGELLPAIIEGCHGRSRPP